MASDQQFCLRWNNHQSTLVSVFDNLLESQTLVDCTLAADGQYLKAHKVVLSACSPYLEAILCQNLDKHPILILKDVKFSELKAMLDYMYRGEVNISQEQLSTFLKAAESLQIKGLTDSGGGGNSDRDRDREREPLKRQDLRKPLNQPVPHIPQPRPVVPHPGLMERRSLPHFPPHIADMQPQSPRHAREGSTSPTARKRRRPNRPSSDDSNFVSTPNSLSENQPDTSDSCDVPVKQAASSTPNVPNATTKAPETDSNRTTPQPQNNQLNSEQKQQQVTVKKEFSEALLTPKTEFDYGNDNSMEDVTYEDDEEEEVDLSKPGTSFAANSQGFPPWQMGGDGSNDDSNNMYSPDVTAATNQNNSQGDTIFISASSKGGISITKTSNKISKADNKIINLVSELTCIVNNTKKTVSRNDTHEDEININEYYSEAETVAMDDIKSPLGRNAGSTVKSQDLLGKPHANDDDIDIITLDSDHEDTSADLDNDSGSSLEPLILNTNTLSKERFSKLPNASCSGFKKNQGSVSNKFKKCSKSQQLVLKAKEHSFVYKCDLCPYSSKHKGHLCLHKMYKHGIMKKADKRSKDSNVAKNGKGRKVGESSRRKPKTRDVCEVNMRQTRSVAREAQSSKTNKDGERSESLPKSSVFSKGEKLQCNHCSFTAEYKYNLSAHMGAIHNMHQENGSRTDTVTVDTATTETSKDVRKFVCICERRFKLWTDFQYHIACSGCNILASTS